MKDPFAPKPEGLRLKPVQVAGFQEPIDLVEGRLTLGRADDNDVVLAAETFPSVSNHHARLERNEDGKLVAEDLGSKNGTLINGKRVERGVLAVGDVLQLGGIGPRFIVVSTAPLSETMFVDPKSLGIGEDDVEELVKQRARRQALRIAILGMVTIGVLAWWINNTSQQGREQTERAHLESLEVIEKLRAENRAREDHWETIDQQRTAHIETLNQEMANHEGDAATLRGRLASLEESGASTEEIARLEEALEATRFDLESAREELSLFNPVNLEESRLTRVSAVKETVVLIEVAIQLERDGRILHVDLQHGYNWDDIGRPFTADSTGTGFVVSEEGYILTNAHVVQPSGDGILLAAQAEGISTRIQLHAVFSERSQRHPLEVLRIAQGVDLALAKIAPFEGMPHLEDFTTDVPPPADASEVYLVGFPLGNFALQEGRRVIASIFRGIVSRSLSDKLQVDAGVHPGNSGGPIIDPTGRVVGIVVSVQQTPEQERVYAIGYGIPVHLADQLWPPPADGDEAVDEIGD